VTVSTPNLVQKFAMLQQHVEELQCSALHEQGRVAGVPLKALEKLRTALDELHTAQEELSEQNEELARARQAVEVERQRYQELFDFAPDGYLITTTDGTIQEANRAAAALLQVSQRFLIGKQLLVFVPQAERKAFRASLGQFLHTGKSEEWEVRLQPRGGALFDAALAVAAVRDATDSVVGLRWLLRDITQRKRAEAKIRALNEGLEQRVKERTAELEESEQRFRALAREQEQKLIVSDRLVSFGELTATLAHEFNNPLGIVIGFVQDLLTEMAPASPHFRSLKVVEEEALRCKALVKDLLEFAAHPLHATPSLMDLEAIVRKSLELISFHLQKQQVQTVIAIQPHIPLTYADPQQLQQVLLNVFFNAVEAMPNGGTLTVQATTIRRRSTGLQADSEPPVQAIITVTDTGVGITAEDLPKIFRPFFTAKKTRGMGLGLSICESIMKAHGGTIEVKSKLGHGTTVRLVLPLEQDAR